MLGLDMPSIRAVMLTDDPDRLRGSLMAALRSCLTDASIAPATGAAGRSWLHLLQPGGRLPGGGMLRLLGRRPNLVVAELPGPGALSAALYRLLVRRSRLLVWSRGAPARHSRLDRLVLRCADAVMVDGIGAMRAFERLGIPHPRIVAISDYSDTGGFSACPPTRTGRAAHRLVHVGPLTPQAGVADLLIDCAAWAERHPERRLELWWVGDGDLRGVLEAQPLPGNLAQRFLRHAPDQLAAVFAECGLLVVPTLARATLARTGPGDAVPEALAAGLPVLGSLHSRAVRTLVQDRATGWVFDPLDPAGLAGALDEALAASAAELDQMRAAARAGVVEAPAGGLTERIGPSVAAMLREALEPAHLA